MRLWKPPNGRFHRTNSTNRLSFKRRHGCGARIVRWGAWEKDVARISLHQLRISFRKKEQTDARSSSFYVFALLRLKIEDQSAVFGMSQCQSLFLGRRGELNSRPGSNVKFQAAAIFGSFDQGLISDWEFRCHRNRMEQVSGNVRNLELLAMRSTWCHWY